MSPARALWSRFLVALVLVVGSACDRDPSPRVEPTEPAQAQASPSPASGRCEHGVPEGLCPKCNPALAAVYQAKGDWCDEHGFPESFCPTCNPDTTFPDVGAAPAPAPDWCGGHGLPESKCTKCHPDLIAQFQATDDWCDEHGFPESVCPTCNPQAPPASAITADWCLEHALPESKCSKCNPAIIAELEASGDWCAEHGFPESVCPICNPQAPPAGAEQAAIEARVVRLRSPDLEASAGIETVTAERVTSSGASVECTARLAFHGDKIADIRAIVPGIVREVHVELGDVVTAEARLFELESPGVGETQADLQAARERVRTATNELERQRELRKAGASAEREVDLAEADLAAAQAELSGAKISLRMVGAGRAKASGHYTLTSPIAGVVIERPAVLGTLASEDTSLATVTDTSVLWAMCDVPEAAIAEVELGQTLQLTLDGRSPVSVSGAIDWIAVEVDPRTRTVAVRAELPNPAGALRANQYGRARIETSPPIGAVAVPRAAVQRVGALDVVFVRTSVGVYEPRVVRRHSGGGDAAIAIEGRVADGDAIVTTGAVLLRTEILPGSIGAGCCEVEPAGDD